MHIWSPRKAIWNYYILPVEELYLRYNLRRFNNANNTLYVLSAFPKSGSKYLAYLIKKSLPSAKKISAKGSDGFGHNFIALHRLVSQIKENANNLVCGHHPYNGPNKTILQQFHSCKIVVGIRPLPDVLVSYKEHVEQKEVGPLDYGIKGISECYPEFHCADDKTKFDYILRFVMPWYVRFVYTWIAARRDFPVSFITFEEQTQYPKETILKVDRFFDIPMDACRVDPGRVDREKTHYNRGVRGRGLEVLTDEQISELEKLIWFFEDLRGQKLGRYLVYGYGKEEFSVKDVAHGMAAFI